MTLRYTLAPAWGGMPPACGITTGSTMPEILTESFCERCGTRYTFQSSAPKVGRMAKMKVLSRGLKNYVLSDETSLDEALADARSIDDREQSVEQLDAFHKTFNFCMSCRQYTCANCWNDREGRCLSCAPSLSVGILPSGMPALNPIAGMAALTNGHAHDGNGHGPLQADGSAWPQADLGIASDDSTFEGTGDADEKPVSRLEALFGREEAARIKASAPVYDDDEPTSVPEMIGLEESTSKGRKAAPKPELKTEPAPELEPVAADADATTEPVAAEGATEEAAAEAPAVLTMVGTELDVEALDAAADAEDAIAEPETDDAVAAIADVAADDEPEVAIAAAAEAETADTDEAAEPVAAAHDVEPIPLRPVDPETDGLAAAAAAQTHGLLDKFRARPVPITAPTPILSMPSVPHVVTPPPALVPTPPPSVPAPMNQPYAAAGPMAVPAAPQPYGVIGRPPAGGSPYAIQPAMPYAQTPPPYEPIPTPPYAGPIGQPYAASAAPVQPYPAPPQQPGTPPPTMYPPFQPGYTSPPLQPQYALPPPQPQYAPPPPPAPSWRMVAPESPYVAPAPTNGNGHVYTNPPPPTGNEPQWPDTPSWPTPVPAASRTRGAEAVWAESTRDLLSRPETGVSACFSCGLPLSATARFCRRCGTSQVSS